jgi:hypothetical protein
VDARTNAPVRGARVFVADDVVSVHTDGQGRFSIDEPGPPTTLIVTKPGYLRAILPPTRRAEQGQTVRLQRSGVLVIHVFDQFAEPKRTQVRVQTVRTAGASGGTSMSGGTDERGIARVRDLRTGRYRVRTSTTEGRALLKLPPDVVRDRDFYRAVTEALESLPSPPPGTDVEVDVREGEETVLALVDASPPVQRPVLDLVQRPEPTGTARIEGRVIERGGLPVRNASVRLVMEESAQLPSPPFRETRSDADGRFAFRGLPAARFSLRVSRIDFYVLTADGARTADALPAFALRDGETRSTEISLTRAPAVRGRVLDEYGDPVDRARVFLADVRPDRPPAERLALVATAATDDMGRYEMRGVRPGRYALFSDGEFTFTGESYLFYPGVLSAAEAEFLEVQEAGDLENVDFVLNRRLGGRVTGVALTPDGIPLGNATLQMLGTEPDGTPAIPRMTRTSRWGGFQFLNVPPGTYAISVARGGQPRMGPVEAWRPPDPGTSAASNQVIVRVTGPLVPPVTLRAEPVGPLRGRRN